MRYSIVCSIGSPKVGVEDFNRGGGEGDGDRGGGGGAIGVVLFFLALLCPRRGLDRGVWSLSTSIGSYG
jgi:hypothetical protein